MKLGPFKFEILSNEPQIGYVHDFISNSEIHQVIADAIPRTKTTPYGYGGDYYDYSRWRTSKVMYINEKHNDNAMQISRKIELMTRTQLTKDMYDSENYQVIQGFVTHSCLQKYQHLLTKVSLILLNLSKDHNQPALGDH